MLIHMLSVQGVLKALRKQLLILYSANQRKV